MFDGFTTEQLEERYDALALWEVMVQRTRGSANWSEEYRTIRWLLFGQDDPEDVWNNIAAIYDELANRSA